MVDKVQSLICTCNKDMKRSAPNYFPSMVQIKDKNGYDRQGPLKLKPVVGYRAVFANSDPH